MSVEYEIGFNTPAAGAGTAYFNLWAATRALYLAEVKVGNSTNNGVSDVRLVRTSARGTQTTTITPTAASNALIPPLAPAPTALIDTAWSVAPTFQPLNVRLTDLAAAVESGEFWNWEQNAKLWVPSGAGLALFAGGAGQVLRVWIRWGE